MYPATAIMEYSDSNFKGVSTSYLCETKLNINYCCFDKTGYKIMNASKDGYLDEEVLYS